MLQDPVRKVSLSNAIDDLNKLVLERKKNPDERDEFLFCFDDRPETFFGRSLKERRRVCCSAHNYCIFSHTVDECRCDQGVNVWDKATSQNACIFHHDPECCKCDRVAMVVGQDESVFHAYILGTKPPKHTHTHTRARAHTHTQPTHHSTQHTLSYHFDPHTQTPHTTGNRTWYVQNKVGLRKKSNGPGCHVSGFVGYTLGFGLKVNYTTTVLRKCNQVREDQTSDVDNTPKEKLLSNPAIRYVWGVTLFVRYCNSCVSICVCTLAGP